MDNSVTDSVFQAYFESYRTQNIETKNIHQPSCEGGVSWAWLNFGECLLTPSHLVGYLIGTLSLLLWTVGNCIVCIQIRSTQYLWYILILTFIVNLISFAGAVMSLQIMFLISYDMVTTGLTMVVLIAAALVVLIRHLSGNHQYQPICKKDGVIYETTQRRHLGEVAHKVCSVPMYMSITSLLIVVCITVTSTKVLIELSPDTPEHIMGLRYQVPLSIAGYILGCLACVGRWYIEMFIVVRFLKEIQANRAWKGSGAILITSDILYTLGVLLQSGNIRVTIVTLPWLIESKSEEWNTNEGVVTTLLESTDSEGSNTHVLFERPLCLPGKKTVSGTIEEIRPSVLPWLHTFSRVNDAATTTDSDLSSISQERELMWDYDYVPHRIPTSSDLTTHSHLRHHRLSLASQIETLSQASSETSDQRVRCWISQSTPEEESPSLTLTLNLDSTYDSVFHITDDNFVNKKFKFDGSCPISPRKYSC